MKTKILSAIALATVVTACPAYEQEIGSQANRQADERAQKYAESLAKRNEAYLNMEKCINKEIDKNDTETSDAAHVASMAESACATGYRDFLNAYLFEQKLRTPKDNPDNLNRKNLIASLGKALKKIELRNKIFLQWVLERRIQMKEMSIEPDQKKAVSTENETQRIERRIEKIRGTLSV